MSNDSSAIVQKVWNYAHVLKNAGVGYGDYVEQITYLLFGFRLRPNLRFACVRCAPILKLADEMTELGFDNPIPAEFQWSELSSKSGDELEWSGATWTIRTDRPEGGRGGAHQVHYRHTLENLGTEPGLVGIIFRKAQNKIFNPSDLQRVIEMIVKESWLMPSFHSRFAAVERFRESLNLGQSRIGEGVNRDQADRTDSDLIEGSPHTIGFQDLLQELHLIDQSTLGEAVFRDFKKKGFEMLRDKEAEHSQVLLILTIPLLKAQEAVAFALEEKDWVDHSDSVDHEGPILQLLHSVLSDTVDIRHNINGLGRCTAECDNTSLSVSRRGTRHKSRPIVPRPKELERGVAGPDIAVLRGKGSKFREFVPGTFRAVEFRPEVDCLPAFKEVVRTTGAENPKKRGVIADPGFRHFQRPTACFKFEMRALSKKPSGKMEFSRCSFMGSSPFLRRAASDRRETRFTAARDFRSALTDAFIFSNETGERHCLASLPSGVARSAFLPMPEGKLAKQCCQTHVSP